MKEALYSRSTSLLEAEIDEEIIGLDRERGEVFGFNSVASDVWRLLDSPRSQPEICREIQRIYEVEAATCEMEIAGLLGQMLEMNLVQRIQEG